MMKAPASMRIWFALLGAALWTGILLTGFATVSWLLYLPAAALTVASIIGFCPTHVVIAKLFGGRQHK
jgi:hypothetical protein